MTAPRDTTDCNSTRRTGGSGDGAARARRAKIRETLEARDTLADALTRAGIQLPAMDVRTPRHDAVPIDDGTDTEMSGAARYALVHLGVCSAPVAIALAAVIVRGTSR